MKIVEAAVGYLYWYQLFASSMVLYSLGFCMPNYLTVGHVSIENIQKLHHCHLNAFIVLHWLSNVNTKGKNTHIFTHSYRDNELLHSFCQLISPARHWLALSDSEKYTFRSLGIPRCQNPNDIH